MQHLTLHLNMQPDAETYSGGMAVSPREWRSTPALAFLTIGPTRSSLARFPRQSELQ